MESIERMRQSLNPSLEIEGIVLTMYDARNSLARQVVEQIRGHFGEAVYQTMIPRNVTLAEAPVTVVRRCSTTWHHPVLKPIFP